MKRIHLQIAYCLLWTLTIGFFLIVADTFRYLAVVSGQAVAIARFMMLFGPAFFALYLLTALLFDVREKTVTMQHLKAFLQRRRLLIGLFLFSMILFVLLSFYGVSFKR